MSGGVELRVYPWTAVSAVTLGVHLSDGLGELSVISGSRVELASRSNRWLTPSVHHTSCVPDTDCGVDGYTRISLRLPGKVRRRIL